MTVRVEIAVRSFFMQCVQIFGVMRLLHRPVPRWRLVSFAALLTFAHVFLIDVVPVEELRFVLVSVVRLASFIWFFETEVFPDALIAYLVPLSLNTLGGLFFPALFTHHLPGILENRWAVMLLGPAAEYTAYLPSIMLACYYLLSDRPQGVEGAEENRTSLHLAWSLVFFCITLSCYQAGRTLRYTGGHSSSYFGLLGVYLIVFPLLVYMLHQYCHRERKNEKVLQYHVKRSTVQEAALRTLREERHDLVNELTLISTYVQMGKVEEALASISFAAAKLHDRHNYQTLPDDAWTTVLEAKKAEAKRLKVDFTIDLEEDPPKDFHEQRLLPKVVMNLVDNAFAAVSQCEQGRVHLSWSVDAQGRRVLAVSNNGPEISFLEGKRIFRGGVTSKNDPAGNHGWGLVICQRIAEELGGTIAFTSSPELTTFTFTIPPAHAHIQEQVTAT
jgi:two-component sensor histidine kinase